MTYYRISISSLIFLVVVFCILLSLGCKPTSETKGTSTPENTLFQLLSAELTGITFSNIVTDNDEVNFDVNFYQYNGGGVATGDINNDGLADILLTGNQVGNKLYLNKGDLKFEDITEKAGIMEDTLWYTGVTFTDINADGWLDIYLCVSANPDSNKRANQLFINNGDLTFTDKAAQYGLNHKGYSNHASFFDYDKDGDLDMYLINNPDKFEESFNMQYFLKENDDGNGADKLYRNNGDRTFTDVSKQAGILNDMGFGLSIGSVDINNDGWIDIYVANDFFGPDYLYINNQNGTFTESLDEYFEKSPLFSMGSDFADINNDGYLDQINLDMMPEDNYRLKTNMPNFSYDIFKMIKRDLRSQYVRNMLQVQNDQGKFQETGFLSGIAQTDWSWGVLFVDIDNDGLQDLYITNGMKRDVLDGDYRLAQNAEEKKKNKVDYLKKLELVSSTKLPNYCYHNTGDLQFQDVSSDWGLNQKVNSNGSAYADLDNDGDLDLVINNIDTLAFVYENLADSLIQNNYLKIKLQGESNNPLGFGTKVWLYAGDLKLFQQLRDAKSFQSSSDFTLHFGLHKNEQVDSITILWLDGRSQKIDNIKANQLLTVKQGDAVEMALPDNTTKPSPLFVELDAKKTINYKHQESNFIDFKRDRLLHRQYSREGPGMAVADVNNDGLEDIYVGGAAGSAGALYLQKDNGSFIQSVNQPWDTATQYEDMGALFFDADNDGDPDLYIASGSNEILEDYKAAQDRLYINDGTGKFNLADKALPTTGNTSCVAAADYDNDGDVDLFVGGRIQTSVYPTNPRSYIFQNDGNGNFKDITFDAAPELAEIGMVTGALWSDYDQDGLPDLVVVGEWMPITIMKNMGHSDLKKIQPEGLKYSNGWWNSITGGDFDMDGDIDYVAGNIGLNSYFKASPEKPLSIYAGDFDGNGSVEPLLFTYVKDKNAPWAGRDMFCSQMPKFNNEYYKYALYADVTADNIFEPGVLDKAEKWEAFELQSSYIENLGDGHFKLTPLPRRVQYGPVYGMVSGHFNDDVYLDLMLVGNSFSNHYELGNYDALDGVVVLGDGTGSFNPQTTAESGFYVPGDAKSLATIYQASKNNFLYVVGNNNSHLQCFQNSPKENAYKFIKILPGERTAKVYYKDTNEELIEFYQGNGYLSQQSGYLRVNTNAIAEVELINAQGEIRKIIP